MLEHGVVVAPDAESSARAGCPGRLRACELVANRPIIDHVLEALHAAGIVDAVIVCSERSGHELRACLGGSAVAASLRLRYAEQPDPVDVDSALELAAPFIGEHPCIVHMADGLFEAPLAADLGAVGGEMPDLALIVGDRPRPHGEHLRTDETIVELPRDVALAAVFGPGALACAARVGREASGPINRSRLAAKIAAGGGSFRVHSSVGGCRYKGDPLDLLELNRIALDRLATTPAHVDHGQSRIEGRVLIAVGASVRASVIVGPAVIGADARISDAYIGPYTSIGAGARVEGAEIERSIVARDASITYVGGRLVASVVGQGARVFRDFSLPRALRLRVGDGTVVGLC